MVSLLADVVAVHREGDVSISLSIGISRTGPDRQALIASADRAMYQAKAAGGSRMVWAPDQEIRLAPAKV